MPIKKEEMQKLFEKAEALYKNEKYEEALECYNQAIQLNPEYAEAYSYKGYILDDLKRYEEALECYNRAIQLNPEHAKAYNNMGVTLQNLKRYEEALECYNRALQLNPEDADAYFNKGIALRDLNRYEEALECYNRAIQLNPEHANAYNNMGVTQKKINHNEEALFCYSKAIALKEKAGYFRNRARLYEEMERYNEAIADWERSLELEPDNAVAQFRLNQLKQTKFPERLSVSTKPVDEEEATDGQEWKEIVNGAVKRFLAAQESSGGFPDGEEAVLEDDLLRRIQRYHEDTEQKRTEKAVEKNIASFKAFTSDEKCSDNLAEPEFYVLRRWNSYTPIVTHQNGASKGGGYFLYMGTGGVVIDPGFNFIENFQDWGFRFNQIDKVFITHAHNDHDADLESILTLLYVYNKDIKKKVAEKLADEVSEWDTMKIQADTEDDVFRYMNQEKEERYRAQRKVIDLYLSVGAFKKHAARLELCKNGEYHVHVIDSNAQPIPVGKDVKIRPIYAKHFDLMSDCDALGFMIEFPQSVILYTGDTGYSPEIGQQYKALREEFQRDNKKVTLLAHIGGFKTREKNTDNKSLLSGKAFYKNHLGRNGLICLAEILRPQCCIISEFGEEFDGYRGKVAELFTKTFADYKITFLPADIGLCINADMNIQAITDIEYPDDSQVILHQSFIAPETVRTIRVDHDPLSYYHYKYDESVNVKNQLKREIKAANKTAAQIRPRH